MQKVIWKFSLKTDDTARLEMPFGSEILCVQTQADIPCIWAVVDADDERVEVRRFRIYGTGQPLPHKPGKYIGTYQLYAGQLVFHVFEELQ